MAYIPPEKAMMNLDINAPTSGGFESVGQSLLAQKRADTARADKKNKRNEQIMGALGLFSFGASAFRGATAKRAQNLKSAEAFSLGNIGTRSNAVKTIASLQRITKGKTQEEILADPIAFEGVRTALRPVITEQLKNTFNPQRYDELAASQVELMESRATKNILKDLLGVEKEGDISRLEKVSRQMFGNDTIVDEDGNRKYVGSDLFMGKNAEEKIAYAFNLTPEAFEGSIKRKYANRLAELENSDGVFNIDNYFNLLAKIGVGKGRGKINIFQSQGEDQVLGRGTVDMFMDAMKIQTDIIPTVQDAIASNSSKDYYGAVVANGTKEGTSENAAIKNINLVEIKEDDIDNENRNSLGSYVSTIAITSDMEEIMSEIDSSIFDAGDGVVAGLEERSPKGQNLVNDSAALFMRLSNPAEEEFAKQLYMPSAHAEALQKGLKAGTDPYETFVKNRIKKFAVDIRSDSYTQQRAKFSLLVALRVGAVEKQTTLGIQSEDFSLNGYTYNSDRVKSLLQPALNFSEKTQGYTEGEAYRFLSDDQKKNVIFLEIDEIQRSPMIQDDQREALLKSLIDNVALDQFGSMDTIVQEYEKWKPIWEGQARHYSLYGNLNQKDANKNAQFQQRLFGNEIDKHFGYRMSKGDSFFKDEPRNPFFEVPSE